jgi:hypothetical protein
MRLKVAIHLIANGLILGLGYYWLGIPESRALTLTWSLVVALVAIVLAGWIYTWSFLPRDGWRTALRNMVPVIAAALVVALVYWLLAQWNAYSTKPSLQIASWLTLKLRKPVRPASVLGMFRFVLWVVRWIVLPVFVIPSIASLAWGGWRGFRSVRWRFKRWQYWIATPLLLLCWLRVPLWLIYWVPHVHGFALQSASVALRFAAAYLLFGLAWLLLAFVTSGGTPRETQPSTVASP